METTTRLINTEKLFPEVKGLVISYLEQILSLHQANICSIVIYGSAAGKDFIHKRSDVNILIIVNKLDFSDLKKSLKLISGGIKKRIVAPLFLTREHMETSGDVFPVEFLEMKENHILVYGEDILSGLEVDSKNLRLQCEHQIKGKLIRIRQAYLEIGLKRKGMEALLKQSLASLIPIFRNLIRLKDKTPALGKEEILTQLSDEFNVDKDIFLAILRDKSNDEKIASQDVEVFLKKYIDQIQKLAVSSDKI
ncbi:MAG: hypothetical protein U9Q08_01790 [Candidatus Omnitrophota bacterium]|nr:hypothetical protein [Candidatus Omnitrophota bacterium]